MSKYIIWDKKSQVITPIGEVLTAEQWADRYPMSKIDGVDLVLNGSSIVNGAICNEYTSFKHIFEEQGCDFTNCLTRQECLDRIEEFETEQQKAQADAAANYVSPEERIAAATEAQLLVAMANSNAINTEE